ncbi:phosphatase PAP2 family protein [Streptomyces sp. NBC_00872]|uniref:phosphatase PAP2 family protein n=1 Tax=Streptomyces sp. NBC_00872 TaxID=2903686 RepID=UPI003863BFF8|nr:phosphatase PAP2 family protein [Streptomyces sp. NBC_00872]
MPHSAAARARASARVGATPQPGVRPRWWAELTLVILIYAAYSAGRLLARDDGSAAVDHGLAILRVEKALFLNAEHPLNRLFTATPALAVPADFVYASLHYLVTPAVLVWIFRRRSTHYRTARSWLTISTLLGLVGFTLLPTSPPRLLDARHGFVDTMAQYSEYGWWGGEASAPRGLGEMTNQFAAMPSLHVGWALWCGVLLWRHARTPLVRWLGALYPAVITVVVMGTANHYFLDAVAGALVMAVGALLTGPAIRAADRLRAAVAARFGKPPAPSHAPAPIPSPAAEPTPEPVPSHALPSTASPEPSSPSPSPASSSSPAPASPASPASAGSPDRAPKGTRIPGRPAPRPRASPIVSGGCETSAGDRFPGRRTRGSTSGTSSADDTPATAR